MGLVVIDVQTRKPCSRSQSASRSLMWLLLGIVPIVGWCIEPVVAVLSTGGKRLGDRLANTQVIEAAALQGSGAVTAARSSSRARALVQCRHCGGFTDAQEGTCAYCWRSIG